MKHINAELQNTKKRLGLGACPIEDAVLHCCNRENLSPHNADHAYTKIAIQIIEQIIEPLSSPKEGEEYYDLEDKIVTIIIKQLDNYSLTDV